MTSLCDRMQYNVMQYYAVRSTARVNKGESTDGRRSVRTVRVSIKFSSHFPLPFSLSSSISPAFSISSLLSLFLSHPSIPSHPIPSPPLPFHNCNHFNLHTYSQPPYVPSIQGSRHGGCRDRPFGCFLYSPTACALHARLVGDAVDEISVGCVGRSV
jgi:hypothetical protein